jgi:exosortase B
MHDHLSTKLSWLALIAFGLLCMYVPTYWAVAHNLWSYQDQAHGPIVAFLVFFLFWQKRAELSFEIADTPKTFSQLWAPSTVFLLGLLTYLVGRSQDIFILDLGSQIFILSALILFLCKKGSLAKLWFPIFFIIFMLPFPLDSITLPMKMAVSYVTENILYAMDYPIAREGVVINIGQYQLLVADACAGMHTLISLEALGLLYLNLVKHDSFARNVLLALLIIPISFSANVIRVMTLTLITYYFGNEVGQGFVHGFAGMFLFIVALVLIITVDNLIQYSLNTYKKWKFV